MLEASQVVEASPAPAADSLLSGTYTIKHTNPLIWYHGRWTDEPSTWWTGTGFKLNVLGLSSLSLNIGPVTTSPHAAVGISVDYEEFRTVNISAGTNVLPLNLPKSNSIIPKTHVVRIATEGWQNNRIELDSLTLNKGALLLPYKPSKLSFQFIGDSLTAGQYDARGVIDTWAFLTGEAFKAEHRINAQPGACLTDQLCWGNYHGVSYQYFRTEDTGYYYTTDHNYTTPWNFKKDLPPTHIFIHIGANDNAYNITGDSFKATYLAFLEKLRRLYPTQPIFILTPFGWPSADGNVYYYYEGVYQAVVDARKAAGDKHIYLVDTSGWQRYQDIFPDNSHPSEAGHAHIAEQMIAWLKNWGLKAQKSWATLPSGSN